MKNTLSRLAVCAGVIVLAASLAPAAPLTVPETSWTLAILPDTQHYEGAFASTFYAQTQFLVDYQDELNLAHVLHEGDITNNNNSTQWNIASTAFTTLETAGITYTMAPGNHDTTLSTRASGLSTYFPVSRLDNQPTYGGIYNDPVLNTTTQNSYSLFSAGGTDWLVLALEYGPRDGVLTWAKGLMNDYSDRQVMVVTHANLYCDSTLYDQNEGFDPTLGGQDWNPHESPPAGGCNDGAEMWAEFKDCANLKFVFNGHVLEDGAGYLAQMGENGNVVHNMLANYQFLQADGASNGLGYMRLLEFAADGTVHVRTYSPVVGTDGQYATAPDQDFVVGLNSLPTVYTHVTAANIAVAEGVTSATVTVTAPQSGTPTVGATWQVNRGDYELVVGNQDVTYKKGVLMATVRENLREGYRATVEVGRSSFLDRQLALSVMQAASSTEINFNTSVAWFGFDAGWRGAHIGSDGVIDAGNGVTAPMVSKAGTGRFTVDLGVDSTEDGLLFVIGNNNSNRVVQTGVLANGSGWDVRVQTNAAQFAATGSDADFSMLYLPLATDGLIGGLYDGGAAANVLSAGQFTMTRESTGRYVLSIPGETPETGMLLLSVAFETTYQGVTAPDDNILNYEAGLDGTFIINSFDLNNSTAITAQNTWFAWAFIDFANPIGTLPGDANGDCVVDDLDAQQLAANWLKSSGATWWDGDFNHDGQVDDRDAAILAAHWQRGSGGSEVPEPATWLLMALGAATLAWRRRSR